MWGYSEPLAFLEVMKKSFIVIDRRRKLLPRKWFQSRLANQKLQAYP
jgi:hypothetical protein